MTTTLNTKNTAAGIVLTFDDGRAAGIIKYLPTVPPHKNAPGYRHYRDGAHWGPWRLTIEAAQFDALAWAADENAKAVRDDGARIIEATRDKRDNSAPTRHRTPRNAFNWAVENGILSTDEMAANYAGDYMYMHSDSAGDHFKHRDTREYIVSR